MPWKVRRGHINYRKDKRKEGVKEKIIKQEWEQDG